MAVHTLTAGEMEEDMMLTGWLLMPLPTVAAVSSQLRAAAGGMPWNVYVANVVLVVVL